MRVFFKIELIVESHPPASARALRLPLAAIVDAYAVEVVRAVDEHECDIFMSCGQVVRANAPLDKVLDLMREAEAVAAP